jgi:hypothetical protein
MALTCRVSGFGVLGFGVQDDLCNDARQNDPLYTLFWKCLGQIEGLSVPLPSTGPFHWSIHSTIPASIGCASGYMLPKVYVYIYIRFKFVHQYLHPVLIASSIFNSYLYAVLYWSVIVCSSLARPYHVDTPRGSFSDGGLVTQNPLYCMINSIKREKHNKSITM